MRSLDCCGSRFHQSARLKVLLQKPLCLCMLRFELRDHFVVVTLKREKSSVQRALRHLVCLG